MRYKVGFAITSRMLLLFLPFLSFAADVLEVALQSSDRLPSVYLARLHVPSSEFDWRYFEEIREVLQSDLERSDFVSVLPLQDSLDDALQKKDTFSGFDL